MLRSRARAASLAAVLALGLTTLAACGEDTPDSGAVTGDGLESVTISGEYGEKPQVEWDGRVGVADTETDVPVEGDGAVVEDGDTVVAHWWIGNAFTQEESQTTYPATEEEGSEGEGSEGNGDKGKDEEAPEADPAESAQSIQLTKDVIPALRDALIGRKVGSRVVVLAPAEDAFGDAGNPQLGIGNKDSVLFVVDIFDKIEILDGPQGADREPAKWAPEIVEEGGVPTGFDFAGTKPDGTLHVTTLVKGDGPVVEKGQTIHVNYLGQVHQGEAPFDDSYSRGEPTSFPIGVGQVVAGWDQGLVGRTVGSRLILQIPPQKGYGEKGNEGAGIKGTDTLYFVVDILGVS